jgi:hypothetical protein
MELEVAFVARVQAAEHAIQVASSVLSSGS